VIPEEVSKNIANIQSTTVNVNQAERKTDYSELPVHEISMLKQQKRILFIDDDKSFKIVAILKRMGWINTKIVTDLVSLDSPQLQEADVVLVDIQGVGKRMAYHDEGLGLALAIKRRFPSKKLIIYSAQDDGTRFHEALQEADYSLSKTAEPIRFEEVIIRVITQ